MRLIFLSDTHGKHDKLTNDVKSFINDYENTILIHAGDVSNVGKSDEIYDFLQWFSSFNCANKVFCAGNHDFGFEIMDDIAPEYKEMGVTYLMDKMVEIKGLKIYGSPFQPRFYDWAFNVDRGEAIAKKWEPIPTGLDILITHGPVHGILDYTPNGLRVGCEELYKKVIEVKPRIHCCGHIHYARGLKEFNDTIFINASNLGENYQYINKPIVLEYDSITKEWDYVNI